MSPRALANGFLAAGGSTWLIGSAMLALSAADLITQIALGLMMIAAVSAGTGIGIRMQESHEDDLRRADEAEQLLMARRGPSGVEISTVTPLTYRTYCERGVLPEPDGERLFSQLDTDTDTFRRIMDR